MQSLYCAAVALADVTSANVVGYNTVTIKPGWNMLAVNFKNVADDNGVSIQDLFPGGGKTDTVFTPGAGSAYADYIQVWDATEGKYTTYLLYKPAKGTSAASYTWTDTSLKTVTTDIMTPGKGAWYYHRGEGFNLEIKKQF